MRAGSICGVACRTLVCVGAAVGGGADGRCHSGTEESDD
jgi:hypothetical protein